MRYEQPLRITRVAEQGGAAPARTRLHATLSTGW